MNLKQMQNLLALRTQSGEVIGFHSEKLEVAKLSEAAWIAMDEAPGASSALSALQKWNAEPSPDTTADETPTHQVRSMTLNVTQVCNLHCVYCAAGGDGSFGDPVKRISIDKTLPQLRFFLGKLQPGDEFRLTFLGGEPLLYPEGIELIVDDVNEFAARKNLHVQFVVVTNGTQFHERSIQLLQKMQAQVTISIDGPAEINDRLRPNKGGQGVSEKTIKGIRELLLHKAKIGRIGFSGVFGSRNPDLLAAYHFYQSFDIDWFDFTFDHLETCKEVSDSYTAELGKVAALAFQEGGEKQLRKIKLFDTYFEILDQQKKVKNFCGAGKTFLIADARNHLYACPWLVGRKDEIVGTGENLFSEKLVAYQKPLVELNSCQDCWARFVCGGGCMFIHENKTGHKHHVDENFCERTRHLIASALMYYEKCRSIVPAN